MNSHRLRLGAFVVCIAMCVGAGAAVGAIVGPIDTGGQHDHRH
jgi:hypothetical protein